MATLQKFKLFVTQCTAVNIPTLSLTRSLLLLLRRRHRRKTLRMLLTRCPQISDSDHHQTTNRSSLNSPPSSVTTTSDASCIHRRLKLKDLFFSSFTSSTSHSCDDPDRKEVAAKECDGIGPVRSKFEIIRPKAVRPGHQPYGCRNKLLLRKAWRPVLSTIDEIQV